ncbi:MAG: hypothetical protein ACIAQF_13590 [Phycisphaerales bacterium JB065]
MTVQKQTLHRVSLVLSLIAVVLGVVAVVVAMRPAAPQQDDSYERVVREVWEIMQPVYADFDVALSEDEQEPKTLRDALEPLVRISRALRGGS